MATGYGRTSSLNRIQYYRGSNSRTYKGVKTPRMVADMSARMQKAQDTAIKDSYTAGRMTTDRYISYLTNRIAQTGDPTYRNTLTEELQNLTTTDNEKQLEQGYSDGTVTAGQLEAYYKNKLAGLTPGSGEYVTTKDNIAKWGRTANQDAYKSQEAVLKEQYNGAADKLSSAQKLLHFYVQQTQALTPGTPDYNTAVQNVGTYQSEVRKLSFEQQLLKSEDQISQAYAKDTPENWQAKAQAYAQLRDAAAAQGDITNFYKYDELANKATDNVATSQAKVVSKQVNEAIKQTQADYLSGKIDGATAQDQMKQIADAALQANDTNGVIVAHDYYNNIESDINHGVSYGGDNGFGKTKGGSGGDSGWFDGTAGTPIGGGSVSSAGSSSGDSSSSIVPSSTKAVSTLKTSTSGASTTINNLDQVLNAAKFTNPSTTQLQHLSMIQDSGGTPQDMVLYLRTQKVGTGDGWTALQETYNKDMQEINQKALEGYDPATGQAFTAADAAKAIRGEQTAMASLYMAWGNVAAQNPNMKINIDGVNTKVGTLTNTINEKLNGKVDTQTGLVKKGDEGFLTQISQPLNPEDAILVQDKNNPNAFISTTKAAFEAANGILGKSYIPDSSDPNRFFFVNNNDQKQNTTNFNNQQAAIQAANKFNTDNKDAISKGLIQAVQPVQNGAQWTVTTPNMEARTATVFGPNGQSITYVLDGANNPVSAIGSTKGVLPEGYTPKSVMSFGAARESVPAGTMGFKLQQGQQMAQPTQQNPANTSTRYGSRYTSQPTQPQMSINPLGASNTSTRSGNVYTNQANTSTINGPRYTAGPVTPPQDNRVSITGALNNSLFANNPLLNNPIQGVLARPIDQLIQSAFNLKPQMSIAPASVIPASTPVRTPSGNVSFPQQTQQVSQPTQPQSQPAPQQSPSAPSAPLSIAGSQPQSNIQSYVQQTNTPKLNISGPNIPVAHAPENLLTNIGNAVSNAWNGAGNVINSGLNSAANFFGGFKL